MADILRKLEGNTDAVVKDLVSSSKDNPDIGFAIEAKRTADSVTVSRYDIRTETKPIINNVNKTFYHVVDNTTGEVVADTLGLFESAMGIIKHLLYTNKIGVAEEIIKFDDMYVNKLTEMYQHKARMRLLSESTEARDISQAKFEQAKQQLAKAKMNILRTF